MHRFWYIEFSFLFDCRDFKIDSGKYFSASMTCIFSSLLLISVYTIVIKESTNIAPICWCLLKHFCALKCVPFLEEFSRVAEKEVQTVCLG